MVSTPKPVSKPGNPSTDPRDAARALLAGVRDGASLADQISMGALEHLPPAARARAQRLASMTVRELGRADAALKPHLRRVPPLAVLDILRLAVVEIHVAGNAPHGVVHDAVSATRRAGQKAQAAAGMVNAVLRRASEAEWAALPPSHLPNWLRRPIAARWGKAGARAIEAAHAVAPPLDLTVRNAPEALLEMGQLMPNGSLRISAGGQVTALPGYAEGAFWVQDAAAAMPAQFLDPQPGEVVLDLCAAPGGKTMQLAAAGAKVTAIDVAPQRLERLRENLSRTGLQAEIVVADAATYVPPSPPDAILLDAPCSATGTIRRHPELPYVRDGSGVDELTTLQSRLIDHALEILRPGGRMVYAVCSLLPAEGEEQIKAALARHPEVSVEAPAAPYIEDAWRGPQGIRLRPDYWSEAGGMDGFFIALLRKHPAPA